MVVLLSATLNSASEAKTYKGILGEKLNHPVPQIILDNFQFQYGKTWKLGHGFEATTGISNGIAWYPSFLNFGKNFRMAIGDWHLNLIGAVYDAMRVDFKQNVSFWKFEGLAAGITLNIFRTLHLLSFEFFSFVKLKLISIGCFAFCDFDKILVDLLECDDYQNFCWTDDYADGTKDMNSIFMILAPVLQIDIKSY